MAELGRFVPQLALAVVFGALAGLAWARLARTGTLLGMATTITIGIILAVTLSPVGPGPVAGYGSGLCDVTRWAPGPLDELLIVGDAGLNVVLFMPLGLFTALHGHPAARRLAFAGAATLPFVVELVQLRVPSLGRFCDSRDIADNELGLILGFVVGLTLVAGLRVVRSIDRSDARATVD